MLIVSKALATLKLIVDYNSYRGENIEKEQENSIDYMRFVSHL